MSEQADSNNKQSHGRGAYGEPINDVAIFLDLDNLVIGAKQAGLNFDINLVLIYLKNLTNGRIVLRNSYGDWRQSQQLMKELASAGFNTQSTIRLNNFSKNLADMQIVVDTMDTLIDGHQYSTYILMTGDRDFTPLVQSLRKRGKNVIGVGVKHTASPSFVDLCDRYVFYEDIVPKPTLTDEEVELLLVQSVEALLKENKKVRASVLKEYMSEASNGAFEQTKYADGRFSKFLKQHADILELEQDDSTLYICRPKKKEENEKPLYKTYRVQLKKRKLRIIEAETRLQIIKDVLKCLQQDANIRWRNLIDMLSQQYVEQKQEISKNEINAILLLMRRAEVIRTFKEKSLSTAPIAINIQSDKLFQEAVMRCDATYLEEIVGLPLKFDIAEATRALYYPPDRERYLTAVMKSFHITA
jgi:uncharacterized LabA/DUF88 family protein